MGIFSRERKELEDAATSDDTPRWEYFKLSVRMLGAGQYAHEYTWTFGYNEKDDLEVLEYEAVTLSRDIMGDGTGIWVSDDGHTRIQRLHLVSTNIEKFTRHTRWL